MSYDYEAFLNWQTKKGFVPGAAMAADPAAAGGGDPAMAGGAGMDPSMGGGMDPSMMGGAGMDPSMMGGGMGMDPSMMGGGMDPSMGGGMGAGMGGQAGMPPKIKIDPGAAIIQTIRILEQIIEHDMGGGEAEGQHTDPMAKAILDQVAGYLNGLVQPGGSGGKPKVDVNTGLLAIQKLVAILADTKGIHIPASHMVATPDELMQAAAGGGSNPLGLQSTGGGDMGGGAAEGPMQQAGIQPVQPVQPLGGKQAQELGTAEPQGSAVHDQAGLPLVPAASSLRPLDLFQRRLTG